MKLKGTVQQTLIGLGLLLLALPAWAQDTEGSVAETATTVTVYAQPESPKPVVRRKARSTWGASRNATLVKPMMIPDHLVESIVPIQDREAVVSGNEESTPVDQASSSASETLPPAEPNQMVNSKTLPKIGVHVVDWSLSEILGSITAQTGINIVLATSQNPKITVNLKSMPVDEVLRVISGIADMKTVALKSGGFVVAPDQVLKSAFSKEYDEQIAKPAAAAQATANGATPKAPAATTEKIVVETYRAEHVSASELKTSLLDIFEDELLKVATGPGKVLPALGNGGGTSGESGSGGNGGNSSSGAGNSPNGENGKSGSRVLVLRGPASVVEAALGLARQLDRKQPQVNIKVQIHDINDDAVRDLGIDWSGSTSVRFNETVGNDINFGSFSRNGLNFTALLRHLEKEDRAKLLAQPNVSVMDGENGYILIGDRVNFPVIASFNDAGQPVFDIREEKVGIYLQVSAAVNDQKRVTLNLYPQVSTITGFLEIPNQGSYPQISTREARTSVRVKTGETVVIGGLMREEDIRSVQKVPLLSQIPLFGELFTRRKTTKHKSQVIISITPTIIEDEP